MIIIFLQQLAKFLYFLLVVSFLMVVPGRWLLTFVRKKLSEKEAFFLSLIIGLVFFTLAAFILGFLALSSYFYLLFCCLAFVKLKPVLNWKAVFKKFSFRKDFYLWLLILLGSLGQNLSLLTSGLLDKKGDLVFQSDWAYHDFSWHLALIKELQRKVPPLNPVFKAQALKDYHYFYNLLLAAVSQVSRLEVIDLLYRFFPFLISIILGLGVYLFVKRLTSKKPVALLSLFLTYFAGSFAYFIPLLKDKSQSWGESSFWVSQTFSMAIQPHFLLSVAIIFAGLILLDLWFKTKDKKLVFLLALIWGTVVGFKAYALLLIAGGLIFLTLEEVIVRKNWSVLGLDLLTLLVLILAVLPVVTGKSSFFFKPLWFPKAMVASPDRLNMVELILKEEHYLSVGNYLRFIQIKLHQLFLFIAGNLGIRILGFFGLGLYLKKKGFRQKTTSFLLGAIGVSFLFPLLFLQQGTVWNSIQVWYYLLIFFNIFTAFFVYQLFSLLPSKRLIRIFILVLVIGLSLPTTVKSFVELNFKAAKVNIRAEEIEGFKKLKQIASFDSLVLLYPSQRNNDSSLVAAFSGQRVFYAHQGQADLFAVNFKKEEEKINRFFSSNKKEEIKEFINSNQIDYLFLWKEEEKYLSPEFRKLLRLVFNNQAVIVYQIKV